MGPLAHFTGRAKSQSRLLIHVYHKPPGAFVGLSMEKSVPARPASANIYRRCWDVFAAKPASNHPTPYLDPPLYEQNCAGRTPSLNSRLMLSWKTVKSRLLKQAPLRIHPANLDP